MRKGRKKEKMWTWWFKVTFFGMVKWPFQGVKWPPTRGCKGHFESPGDNFLKWTSLHNHGFSFKKNGSKMSFLFNYIEEFSTEPLNHDYGRKGKTCGFLCVFLWKDGRDHRIRSPKKLGKHSLNFWHPNLSFSGAWNMSLCLMNLSPSENLYHFLWRHNDTRWAPNGWK